MGSVVFPTAGVSVTLTLTSMVKLVAVAEVGVVGVAGTGVGGWELVSTEGVGSEIVPDNEVIFHVLLKDSVEDNADSAFKMVKKINNSIYFLYSASKQLKLFSTERQLKKIIFWLRFSHGSST